MRSLNQLSTLISKMKTYESKIRIFVAITLHITCVLSVSFQNFYFQVHIFLTDENTTYWSPSACSAPPSLLGTFLHFRCSPIWKDPSSPSPFATSSTACSLTVWHLCYRNSQNSLCLTLLWHLTKFQLQHDMCVSQDKLVFYKIICRN